MDSNLHRLPKPLDQEFLRPGNLRGWTAIPRTVLVFFLVGASVLLVSSCSSLSEFDCFYTDWYSKGLVDGSNGATMDQFNRYVKDCARHSVKPDRTDYMDGRENGLMSYCTRARGYDEGRSGNDYKNVCPASMELDFRSGYVPGRKLYIAEHEVELINARVYSLNREIAKLEREILKLEEELLDKDTDDDTKETRLRQIKRRQSEIIENEVKIREVHARKVNVLVNYRLIVREVQDLGFPAVERF